MFREGKAANGHPMVIKEVQIEQKGNHPTDYADANEAAGYGSQGGFSHQGGVSQSKK